MLIVLRAPYRNRSLPDHLDKGEIRRCEYDVIKIFRSGPGYLLMIVEFEFAAGHSRSVGHQRDGPEIIRLSANFTTINRFVDF